MRINFIKSSEKKRILQELENKYGIAKLPYLLIQAENKIYGYSGSLSKEELSLLARELRIEKIGISLMGQEKDGIILSFDSASLLSVKKSVLELSDKQKDEWMAGKDIEADKSLKGFFVLKHKQDFLGTGKSSQGRITNLVPRERRIKS